MSSKIVLMGSGNVASHLGQILYHNGHQILQVYSRNLTNAVHLAKQMQADAIDQLKELNTEADFYLICIKDDAIQSISAECSNYLPPHSHIAHTSGVNSRDLIDPYFIHRGLFYPLQSFSLNSQPDWTEIPIFTEGSEASLAAFHELAATISHKVYHMNDAIRTHLHLASVFANNFTNFNLIIAKQILESCNVPLEVLNPLMTETILKAFKLDPIHTQTGPAKRMDTTTLEKHIRLLVSEFPEYRTLYKKYSLLIMQTFKHENPRPNSTPTTAD
ncbi:MAG: DUF2520 domain-containing protein [Saprospiraceae bacterium]|nr:DUF2520 domain-containing protein [Saprospiraceae bacterium]